MKTFIYFSQGEWRTFQAEELPVKPDRCHYCDNIEHRVYFLCEKCQIEWDDAKIKYESEIAALKAKSVKVGNINEFTWPHDFHERLIDLGGMKVYQWPGTVEVQEEMYCTNPPRPVPNGLKRAILKLPA